MEPIVNRSALVVGRLVHSSLEQWMLNTDTDIDTTYMTQTAAAIQDVRKEYRERVGAPISEEELIDTYEETRIGQAMVNNYVQHWGSPLPEGYTLVQPEQTCLVRIPGAPDNTLCSVCGARYPLANKPIDWCMHGIDNLVVEHAFLEATLDGLAEQDSNKTLWVIERKTYKQRPRIESLQMNDQFLAYVWVLRQICRERNLGEVGGVLYDGMWKRDGTSKRHTADDLFLRHTIIRSPFELDEFEKHLLAEYMDMVNPAIYPNRRWEGCWDCPYRKLCDAESLGEDVEYVRETYYKTRNLDSRVTYEESDGDS